MGDVLPFRTRQQPSEGGADGFQPAAPLVSVVVHRPDTTFADFILAGSEFVHAWSEVALSHGIAVSLSVVRMGSRPEPTRTRCANLRSQQTEHFAEDAP